MKSYFYSWVSISGRLLGALFYNAPDSAIIAPILAYFQKKQWQDDDRWQALMTPEIASGLSANVAQSELAEQYQTLFIGPEHLIAPPWGSVYLDTENVIFGQSLLELRAFMRYHHISFDNEDKEPEDHIGLMLLLCAYIAETQPECLFELLSHHLLPWAYRYFQLLSEQTISPFYQALAKLSLAVLMDWQIHNQIEIKKKTLYF